jgi:hypothetical protein
MIAITAAITTNTANVTTQPQQPAISYVDEYSITVNKETNCVTVYQKDTDGDFLPVKAMICSVGKNNDDTPSGTFNTVEKYRWRALFGNVYGQYSTRINGHILFHSVYYKSEDPSTLKTEEYNKLGTSASAGCIRLTAADAKWIYDNCKIGTQVKIVDGGTDPLPRPTAMKLTANTTYPNWDPTDPSPDNPWKNENVKIKFTSDKITVKCGEIVNSQTLDEILRDGVIAYDSANNIIDFELEHSILTGLPGVYRVKYSASDCIGNYNEVYRDFVVEN